MAREEEIRSVLTSNFPSLAGRIIIQRARRIFVQVPAADFEAVFRFAVNNLGVSFLGTITGLDEGDNFGFIYHLAAQGGIMLNLKISVPKGSAIKTITPYFPSADIYERELVDLLGAEVEGLAEGRRYPLPDDWPSGEHPLLKDWKPKDKRQEPAKNA
jgi:Ni,Fe-hydrogenase III component G